MTDEVEYRCFVGNLSWSTSDRGLKAAFEKFGNLLEAKVVIEKDTGRSRGFGFVTFDEKQAMEKAIEAMNGIDLDGRNITVDRSSSNQGSGRDYDDNRSRDRNRGRDRDHNRDRDHDRGREFGRGRGGGGGGGGGECFKCGKPGHFARECPSDGTSGGRYGGRDDRYGGSRGGSHYGPDRNGDRFGGRNRDNGGRGGGDRYGRDRAGPYDRRGAGGY